MHKKTSKKGFTLVEIMIVVVIIGLLAAMAIPAFQKVRQDSRKSAVANDARQLASAAQQYMLENNKTQAAVTIADDGAVTGDIADYVKRVATGYTTTTLTLGIDASFGMEHPQLKEKLWFTPEGQLRDADAAE